jgi:hypothetical protein
MEFAERIHHRDAPGALQAPFQKDPVSHDLNSAFTSSWGMSLPSAICLSPSSKPAKKLGFLRDLLQFRTRKFWQLGRDFVETHLSILAHLDRVTPLNLTLNSAAAAPKASHCTCRDPSLSTPPHRDSHHSRDGRKGRSSVTTYASRSAGQSPDGRHFEVRGNPRRPEGCRQSLPPADHSVGIRLAHRPGCQRIGFPDRGAELRVGRDCDLRARHGSCRAIFRLRPTAGCVIRMSP